MDKKIIELQHLIAVKSSNIGFVGYNEGSAFVQFSNGNIYKYNDVPIEQFYELAKAESVGKTFAKGLRSHQYYDKLENIVLTKLKPSSEEIENQVINYLNQFSENEMHKSSIGTQRHKAKAIIEYVKSNN